MAAPNVWEIMNWLDVVLAVGLLGSFLVGLGAGFYRQVAIGTSIVAGVAAASQLTQPLAAVEMWEPIRARFGEAGAEAAAYSSIVLATLAVGLLSILIFRSFFGKTLRFVDSILGAASGVVIGALMIGSFFLGVFHWEETWLHEPIRESYLGSRLAEGARVASKAFPDSFRQRVDAGLQSRLPEVLAGGAENGVENGVEDGAEAATPVTVESRPESPPLPSTPR